MSEKWFEYALYFVVILCLVLAAKEVASLI